MIENLVEKLQELLVEGDVSVYIFSTISSSEIGDWLEKGIKSEAFGNHTSPKAFKENIRDTVTGLISLMKERGLSKDDVCSIILIGDQGLIVQKLVVLLTCDVEKNKINILVSHIENHSPQDIIRLVVKHVLGQKLLAQFQEPNIDYIESVREAINLNEVVAALALKIPTVSFSPEEWIETGTDTSDGTSRTLLNLGSTDTIIPDAILTSEWLLTQDYQSEESQVIVSIMRLKKEKTEVTLWDSRRGIALFTEFISTELENISRKYLLPLWALPNERISPPVKTREVIVDTGSTKGSDVSVSKDEDLPSAGQTALLSNDLERAKSLISGLDKRLETGLIERLDKKISDLEMKIERFSEKIDERLTRPQAHPFEKNDTIAKIQSRIEDTIKELESTSARILDIEERLERIISKIGM